MQGSSACYNLLLYRERWHTGQAIDASRVVTHFVCRLWSTDSHMIYPLLTELVWSR